MSDEASWSRFREGIAARSPALVAEYVSRIMELSSVTEEPVGLYDDSLFQLVELLHNQSDAGDTAVTPGAASALRASLSRTQKLGVPIDDVLRGLHLALEEVMGLSEQVADDLGVSSAHRRTMRERLLAWSDFAMSTASQIYRSAPVEDSFLHRYSAVLAALRNDTPPPPHLVDELASLGVELPRSWWTVVVRPEPSTVKALATRLVGGEASDRGVLAWVGDDLIGLTAARPDASEAGPIGVGPRVSLEESGRSIRLAERALRTAVALGLGGVRDFEELAASSGILADDSVGLALSKRYVLALQGTPAGEALIGTIREYLAANGNAKEASLRLNVHENTLRYRLAQYEQLTSTSLRSFPTRFEIWWALCWSDHQNLA